MDIQVPNKYTHYIRFYLEDGIPEAIVRSDRITPMKISQKLGHLEGERLPHLGGTKTITMVTNTTYDIWDDPPSMDDGHPKKKPS